MHCLDKTLKAQEKKQQQQICFHQVYWFVQHIIETKKFNLASAT